MLGMHDHVTLYTRTDCHHTPVTRTHARTHASQRCVVFTAQQMHTQVKCVNHTAHIPKYTNGGRPHPLTVALSSPWKHQAQRPEGESSVLHLPSVPVEDSRIRPVVHLAGQEQSVSPQVAAHSRLQGLLRTRQNVGEQTATSVAGDLQLS